MHCVCDATSAPPLESDAARCLPSLLAARYLLCTAYAPRQCRFPSTPAFTLPDFNPFLTLEGGKVAGSVDCSNNSTRLKYDVCYNQVSLFSGGGQALDFTDAWHGMSTCWLTRQ